MRIKLLSLLALNGLAVTAYGQMTTPLGSSYVAGTMSGDGLYVTATGVSTTGGSYGHTTSLTVSIYSPSNRHAVAYTGYDTTSQATAYLAFCLSDTVCEDGTYNVYEDTWEYCPNAGTYTPGESQTTQVQAPPAVFLVAVPWTTAEIPKQNGETKLRVQAGKSGSCTANGIVIRRQIFPQSGMLLNISPNGGGTQGLSFGGGTEGQVEWTVATSASNQVDGQVTGAASIDNGQGCTIIPGRQAVTASPHLSVK